MPAPSVAARFHCVACAAEYPLAEARTACAACGELLDVAPDLASFGFSGAGWRDLFDRRRSALLPHAHRFAARRIHPC